MNDDDIDIEGIGRAERLNQHFRRAPERQRLLIEQATDLVEQRAKKLGVPVRTLTNAITDNSEAPDPEKHAKDSAVSQLLARLAERDRGLGD